MYASMMIVFCTWTVVFCTCSIVFLGGVHKYLTLLVVYLYPFFQNLLDKKLFHFVVLCIKCKTLCCLELLLTFHFIYWIQYQRADFLLEILFIPHMNNHFYLISYCKEKETIKKSEQMCIYSSRKTMKMKMSSLV